jgi:hypothetical protein
MPHLVAAVSVVAVGAVLHVGDAVAAQIVLDDGAAGGEQRPMSLPPPADAGQAVKPGPPGQVEQQGLGVVVGVVGGGDAVAAQSAAVSSERRTAWPGGLLHPAPSRLASSATGPDPLRGLPGQGGPAEGAPPHTNPTKERTNASSRRIRPPADCGCNGGRQLKALACRRRYSDGADRWNRPRRRRRRAPAAGGSYGTGPEARSWPNQALVHLNTPNGAVDGGEGGVLGQHWSSTLPVLTVRFLAMMHSARLCLSESSL